MVADNYKKLSQTQLPTGAAAQYTVPGATQAIIRSIVLVNTSGSARTVNLYTDGSAAANKILDTYSIPANSRVELNSVITLAASGAIWGDASAATSVTMTIFGLEIS
jgi:hypothetical protein